MQQLKLFKDGIVRIMETDTGKKVVGARDLHEGLKVKTRFNDWIIRQVEKYGFEEGKDFYSFLGKSTGRRPTQEYILQLNMAKELAMVENNEQGRIVRRYFIDVEEIQTTQKLSQPHIPPRNGYGKNISQYDRCKRRNRICGGDGTC